MRQLLLMARNADLENELVSFLTQALPRATPFQAFIKSVGEQHERPDPPTVWSGKLDPGLS